jgi:hypothetical protein
MIGRYLKQFQLCLVESLGHRVHLGVESRPVHRCRFSCLLTLNPFGFDLCLPLTIALHKSWEFSPRLTLMLTSLFGLLRWLLRVDIHPLNVEELLSIRISLPHERIVLLLKC